MSGSGRRRRCTAETVQPRLQAHTNRCCQHRVPPALTGSSRASVLNTHTLTTLPPYNTHRSQHHAGLLCTVIRQTASRSTAQPPPPSSLQPLSSISSLPLPHSRSPSSPLSPTLSMPSNLQIWGARGSTCTDRALFTAAELGVPVDFHSVDFSKGAHKSPEHMKRQVRASHFTTQQPTRHAAADALTSPFLPTPYLCAAAIR